MRIGTPTITSRGMGIEEVTQIGDWIVQILKDPTNEGLTTQIGKDVRELCDRFPIRT